jgi:hypothetical protein
MSSFLICKECINRMWNFRRCEECLNLMKDELFKMKNRFADELFKMEKSNYEHIRMYVYAVCEYCDTPDPKEVKIRNLNDLDKLTTKGGFNLRSINRSQNYYGGLHTMVTKIGDKGGSRLKYYLVIYDDVTFVIQDEIRDVLENMFKRLMHKNNIISCKINSINSVKEMSIIT